MRLGLYMSVVIIVSVVMYSVMILPTAIFIVWTYIIKPRKTIRDGLYEWYHESDDDF